jgi:hypothetical protein
VENNRGLYCNEIDLNHSIGLFDKIVQLSPFDYEEKNMESLNQAAPFISAIAAVFSAAAAVLAVWFSRRLSTRDRIDILKGEILELVSSQQGREAWIQIKNLSTLSYGGPRSGDLAGLLKRKYQKDKWVRLLPAALEALNNEGYGKLLGFINS